MKYESAEGGERKHPWLVVAIGLGIVVFLNYSYFYIENRWLSAANMNTLHAFHIFMGVVSALILVGMITRHLIFHRVPVSPADLTADIQPITELTEKDMRLHKHHYWFINLRWLAILVALSLIIFSTRLTNLLPGENFIPLILLVAVLAISNVVFTFWAHHTRTPYFCIVVQVISDLVILTAFIHYSGGLENPLYIMYSFHIIISGILLTRRTAYALTLVACGLLGFMAMGEFFHFMKHYNIIFFPHAKDALSHAAYDPYYVFSRFFPFTGILFLTSYFTTLVMDYLRENEKHLEQMARVASAESQKLETAVNAVGAGMLLLDRELNVVWFNRRYQEWFNRGDQILGKNCKLSHGEGDQSSCDDCISAKALEKSMTLEMERKVVSPKQGSRFYHVTASPISNQNGEITQVIELIQDITARKAMEFEMLQTGKMALLGRMAAGIAHEVGNPLSSMSTRIKLMETRKEEMFLRDSMNILQEQISRIRRTIQSISQFTKPQKEDWTLCRINEIVEEAVDVIKLDRRAKGVTIVLSLAESGPVTAGPRDKLFQVFINMGLNAVEAIKDNGTLKISSVASNDIIRVTFRDTGPGIPEEALANLFDPFYTTKEQGQGLGLFLCYSVINSCGGEIEVDTEEGKGTTFTIKLPVRQHQSNDAPVGMS